VANPEMSIAPPHLPMTRRDACPLCARPHAAVDLHFDPIFIRRCAACGFRFADPVYDAEAITELYKSGYEGARHAQGQKINGDINVGLLKRILPGDARGDVLDVGSGFGFLAATLNQTTGLSVSGVELSDAERRFAMDELGVPTYGDLADIPEGKRFQVVTAFEVIEHIADPAGFLRALVDLVDDGGLLVIGTDNFECRAVQRLGRGFPKWVPHQHISCFHPASLERLIGEAPELSITRRMSYTPWEFTARAGLHALTGGRKGGRVFNLDEELRTEDERPFRFYGLRRRVNALWARLALQKDLSGEMMIVAARKRSAAPGSAHADS